MSKNLSNVPKQNFSGHVTLDDQQSRFFQECDAKVHRINRKRECGLLPIKDQRNPILPHEPSPRDTFHGFRYDIPEKKAEPERWTYPETDWGLMSKLNTQKPFYYEIKRKADDKKTIVAEFKHIRETNEALFRKELEQEKKKHDYEADVVAKATVKSYVTVSPNGKENEVKPITRGGVKYQEDEDMINTIKREAIRNKLPKVKRTVHKKVESNESYKYLKTGGDLHQSAPDLFDYKISAIKTLGNTNPDTLAQWRTERAADFVNRKGDAAVRPPAHLETGTDPFFPGGIRMKVKEALGGVTKHASTSGKASKQMSPPRTQRQTNNNANTMNNAQSADSLRLNMDTLVSALEKTNADIARQQLKIALNRKPEKGFEKAKDTRVIVHSAR